MGATEESWIESHPILFEGETVKVRKVQLAGVIPIEEYWNDLAEGKQTSVATIFKLIDVNKGNLSNREKFKKLEDYGGIALREIKAHQVRIGCVWEKDHNLMLLFGCTKKKDDWKKGDLKQLRNIYDQYSEAKNNYLTQQKGPNYGGKERKSH